MIKVLFMIDPTWIKTTMSAEVQSLSGKEWELFLPIPPLEGYSLEIENIQEEGKPLTKLLGTHTFEITKITVLAYPETKDSGILVQGIPHKLAS